jgi:hypothetical protein
MIPKFIPKWRIVLKYYKVVEEEELHISKRAYKNGLIFHAISQIYTHMI